MSGRRWGAAGVRLTEDQVRQRDLVNAGKRSARRARLLADLDKAYGLWRNGQFRPHLATFVLNKNDLYGPEVDEACGAKEPDVDLWEEGKRYPTWPQLVALAELTGVTPSFLLQGFEPIPWQHTSMRFHFPPDYTSAPPVRRCAPAAIDAVVSKWPERRPS